VIIKKTINNVFYNKRSFVIKTLIIMLSKNQKSNKKLYLNQSAFLLFTFKTVNHFEYLHGDKHWATFFILFYAAVKATFTLCVENFSKISYGIREVFKYNTF